MGDIEFRYRDDDELMHSSAGTTWQKKGAAYISRVKKNGKWVYTYAKNKASQAGNAVSTATGNVATSVKRTVNSYTNPYSRKNTLRKAKVNNAKNKATSAVNNVKSSVKSGVTKTQTKITSAYNGVVSSSKKKRKNK